MSNGQVMHEYLSHTVHDDSVKQREKNTEQATVEKLMEKVTFLQKKLTKQEEINASTHDSLQAHWRMGREYVAQIHLREKIMESINSDLHKTQEEIETLKSTLHETKKENETLESSLHETKKEIEALESELQATRKKLNTQKEINASQYASLQTQWQMGREYVATISAQAEEIKLMKKNVNGERIQSCNKNVNGQNSIYAI